MNPTARDHDQLTPIPDFVQQVRWETLPEDPNPSRRSSEESEQSYYVSEPSEGDQSREDYYASDSFADQKVAEGSVRASRASHRSFDDSSTSRHNVRSQTSTDRRRLPDSWEIRGRNIHVGGDNCQLTSSSAGAIGQFAQRDNRATILDWLSPIDHKSHQEETFRKHCPGTGQWILSSEGFQHWLEGQNQTLFCPGIPGAGKTIIASFLIDHLRKQFANDDVGIAYVYGRPYDYTYNMHHIFRSLLKQLAVCRPSIPDAVQSLYQDQKDRGDGPSTVKVRNVLNSVVGLFSRVLIVIDAFDELPLSDKLLEHILSEVKLWQSRYNVSLLATSRPIPSITQYFHDTPTVDIRADREDIKTYVGWRLEGFPSRVKPLLQERIIRAITSAAGGMFLLATLSMNTLAEKRSSRDIRAVLEALPMSPALNEFYSNTLRSIVEGKFAESQFGRLVLSLQVCSQRPVTVTEMQHALAVERVDPILGPRLDENNLPEVDDMLSACLGLLAINTTTDTFYFVHHTAAEYYKRMFTGRKTDDHHRVGRLCVNYLSLHDFKSGACGTDKEYERRLARYPFYEYSAKYWGFHAQQTGHRDELGLNLLIDPARVAVCLQGLFTEPGTVGYSQHYPTATGMHLAAHFGMDRLCEFLIDEGQQSQCKDSSGHTPLWWALERGHHQIVRILKDKDNITLRELIKVGRRDLIRGLLDADYDINSLDFFRRTPLHNAISSGMQDLLIEFVEAGADVSIRDRDGATPLRLAVQLGRPHLADILLGHGASPEDVSLPEWRKLYQRRRFDIAVLTAKGDKGMLIHFIASKEDLTAESHGRSFKRHHILHGACIPWYDIFSIPKVSMAFELAVHISRHEEETEFQYAVLTHMPNRHKPTDPNENQDQLGIAWKVRWETDEDSAEYWQSTDYYSTLPYIWMPGGGIDLLLHFLRYLNQKWVELTESEKHSLETFRRKVFRGKGETRHLLDELLQDADMCNYLRITLQDHVRKLRDFGNEYCRRHEGDDAMLQLYEAIDGLLRDVSQRIDSLDKACQDLIQIEFNLVSINEARLSTSTTMSMKRLSWITFIFLPATFTSTVFGMNINLLEDNPSWWWYLPLLGAILALTLVGWLLFKYNPKVEASIDRRIEAVFEKRWSKNKTTGVV